MLISKFTKKLDTTLGIPLSFSLMINNVTNFGSEFEMNNQVGYLFSKVHIDDIWVTNLSPPLMYVRDEPSDLYKDICVREETEYDFVLDFPMSKEEILTQRKITLNNIFPFSNTKLKNYISINNVASWSEVGKNITRITGRIHFKSYAGVVKLLFYYTLEQIEIEVISYKLEYEDDFKTLLSELAQIHSELILSLDQPTEISLGIDHIAEYSPQTMILHLRRLMEDNNFPLAIQTILANPHVKKDHELIIDDLALIAKPSMDDISSNPFSLDWIKGGYLSNYFKGYTPSSLPEENIEYEYDNLENQYVKFIVEELAGNVQNLLDTLPSKYINSKCFLEKTMETIEGYLNEPFFRNISPFRRNSNSMVLQRRSGYKELIKLYQEFESGIQLDSNVSEYDSIDGDLRPIHKLYEYWCYFSLFNALRRICGAYDFSNMVQRTERGFSLNLREKSESKVSFKYNNSIVNLYFNRDFTQNTNGHWNGTYDGGIYHPDFSIQITAGEIVHWIHYDAKYKLDFNKFIQMMRRGTIDYETTENQNGSYNRNDIHTAHAYRDAILGTRGVYILYPDNIEMPNIFVRNPSSEYCYKLPSIGAIPLRPGINSFNEIQQKQLEMHIKEILDLLTNDNVLYQEELGVIIS